MGFGDISDLDSIEPPALRALMAGMPTGAAEPRRMAEVFEREIDGPDYPLKVRIYRPETATEGPPPIVVYFHGGGFCICDLDTHDATCRSLAHAAGALLVSVDYRLAPEAKFPAAAEDCYAATVSVAAVAAELGGDGGNRDGGGVAVLGRGRELRLRGQPIVDRDEQRAGGVRQRPAGGVVRVEVADAEAAAVEVHDDRRRSLGGSFGSVDANLEWVVGAVDLAFEDFRHAARFGGAGGHPGHQRAQRRGLDAVEIGNIAEAHLFENRLKLWIERQVGSSPVAGRLT